MSRKPEIHCAPPPLPPDRADQIREALERVLESHHFGGSRRCQLLLRYVTEQTILGDIKGLKERSLGVTVFGRPPDYDTSQDPVVRATAGEIRKRLAQYYQLPGHESEPRIELQSGSYVAEFYFDQPPAASAPQTAIAPTAPPPADRSPAPSRRLKTTLLLCALPLTAVLLVLLAYLLLPQARLERSDLGHFWGPILKPPGPVLLCLGQPVAYNLKSTVAQDAIQSLYPSQPPITGSDEGVIPKKDLVILWDRYVALGDSICMTRLTSLFDRFGKTYHIRGERSVTFADLRENTAVLIAAFDNQWTRRAAGPLRFTFVKDSAHDTDLVRDSQHPENVEWRLVGAWPFGEIANDYAVVSRIVHTPTDHPVVIAAGITEYGTRAAGEFLSTPEYFAEVIPRLPRGWENKNIQIVLRVPVVSHVPGHPQILATHVW
ncbi:MAG TPA: hypothetical protein VKU19_08385 [Bryobacteraceae bacterium]|nr:hypothetical protein [Bryobacteraceae bacterium]